MIRWKRSSNYYLLKCGAYLMIPGAYDPQDKEGA